MDDYQRLMLLADIRRELWFDAMAARRGLLAVEPGRQRHPWLSSLVALALAVVSLGRYPALGH
jgi:hypothetical protein